MQERKKIGVVIQDAETHWIPVTPLVEVLYELGYDVVVFSPEKPKFKQLMLEWQRKGVGQNHCPFEWVSSGPNWSNSAWAFHVGQTLIRGGNQRFIRHLFGTYLLDIASQVELAETIVEFGNHHPLVGLFLDPSMPCGGYAGQLLNMPFFVLENGLGRLMIEQHEDLRPVLNEIRRHLRLGEEGHRPSSLQYAFLSPSPVAFHNGLDIETLVPFLKAQPPSLIEVPEWIQKLGDDEPLLVASNGSTGTDYRWAPEDLRDRYAIANDLVIRAAQRVGIKSIVSVGSLFYDDFKHHTHPGQLEIVPRFNQPALAARCAKRGGGWFHAGFGSLSEAWPLGVSGVLFPNFADQEANAVWCHEQGSWFYLPRKGATVKKAANALEDVLNQRWYGDAARHLRDECIALPTLKQVVADLIGKYCAV